MLVLLQGIEKNSLVPCDEGVSRVQQTIQKLAASHVHRLGVAIVDPVVREGNRQIVDDTEQEVVAGLGDPP